MYLIKEEEGILGKYFSVYLNKTIIKRVYVERVKVEKDGKYYLFLLNSQGKVIKEVYAYLNHKSGIVSINALEQAQSALKILYTFSELIEKRIEEFDENDIKNLSNFLLGINIDGNYRTISFISTRGITTHNLYFDAIRRYIKFMNIDNNLLFEIQQVKSNLNLNELVNTNLKLVKFKGNISNPIEKTAPKYISINEYNKIIEYIEENNGKFYTRNKLIVDLMFKLGLRLGEVLGLTLEDIKENSKDSDAGIIILRNRVSDNWDQHAKGCLQVNNISVYKTKVYRKKNKGYQEIQVPYILMEDIREYLQESRDIFNLTDRVLKNINEKAKADIVENKMKNNYYIFLNKNGIPLGASGWNKILKSIYRECEIPVDEGIKSTNISHRLRHGYAMFLKYHCGIDMLGIQRKLRHGSITSTPKYFNPTDEDILQENIEVENKISNWIKGE